MRCYLVKVQSHQFGGVLAPAYAEDQLVLNKLGDGQVVRVEMRKPRNPHHHRLVFALAKLTLDNMPIDSIWTAIYMRDPNGAPYQFIKALMMDLGMVDTCMNIDGSLRYQPKAINFEDMDEEEFQPVSDAIFEACANVLQIPVETLRKEYMEQF